MCGRFVLAVDPQQVQMQFNLTNAPTVAANYNVSPTQPVAVVTNDTPRTLDYHRWGLIPSWAKDMSLGAKMINARAETVDEKPAFRAAFKRRRCLIPASGFYEWRTNDDGKKTPMYIHLKDQELFAFAGLWEIWNSPDGELRTCTILTTDANPFMQTIHNRMPVIMRLEDYDAWLQPGEIAAGAMKALLRQYESEKMDAYEVSKAVNRAGYSTPENIVPVTTSEQPRLL
ncbi:MAG: SOS response-associated peptidase [Chloroflexota bacterium]|nr:SOS response-associated peptidase [Chloroflexota bacterium]